MEARRRAGSLLLAPGIGHFTAGSFFKNPLVDESQVKSILSHEESAISREQLLRQNVIHGGSQTRVSAAHVLLAAGYKRGQTWGEVRLHPDHILKVENVGNATASQIYDVVMDIIFTVKNKLDITLEPEVRFLGEF
jgi:UDP-N-acetylmuramate dehydrogenase